MGNFGITLANKINSQFGDGTAYNSGTPTLINTMLGTEITNYILTNTLVAVTYTGTIPGTPPMPEVGADPGVKVIGTCAPPVGITFDSWLSSLEMNIKTGFMISAGPVVKPITPIPIFNSLPAPLMTFVTQEDIKNAAGDNKEGAYIKVWSRLCDGIVNWITTQLPVPPTYAASIIGTGVATITKISIIN